ncbi:hypothetical protein SAMN05421690_101532 [Nitrosomonas sp. Nm51]|uniref:DUF5658 family protein n=1 Tax=Nitrosomonas sp. Nm51 TaxID=133720 RepID=UPI0008AAF43E|nr:DUF5658 family protein [Nitrosomonas sp. Nm51]SER26473.1 hypothetical protein SAMN05421690_101532 [Nitrosomonas sp. Nm51]
MNMPFAENTRVRERRRDAPFFCAYHLGFKPGRRMNERRSETARWGAVYVDRYANHLMLCVVGILLLSVGDAIFTLKILTRGGEELNWFMAILIDESVNKFVAVKMSLTALALIMLVIHHNVRIVYTMRVRHVKYAILAGYSVLIGYELYLLNLAGEL